MTEASRYLIALARPMAQVYAGLPQAKAVMITGSVAEGISDFYSDIDLTAYYDELPSEEELAAARQQSGGAERIWQIGDRGEGSFAEAYVVRGIEVQIGHATIAAWERDMATVLEQLEVTSPLQKALSGILDCVEWQIPEVDTATARRRLGWRQAPWEPWTDVAAEQD
jgi:hypothetical protein